jgi:dTDP-4-amino-4,6-dideoxygalactose transaminase
MTELRFPVARPPAPPVAALREVIERVAASRQYSNFGPAVLEFEARTSALLPAGEIVSAAHGTIALELALAAQGLPPGTKVVCPALTFPATALAIARAGFTSVFADVDEATWVLTPELAAAAVAQTGARAVVPVATFGQPLPVAAWEAFAARTGVPVVIDAAGAFCDQGPGSAVDVVFSFHATKTLPLGEGGALATTSPTRAQAFRTLCNFGFSEGEIHRPGTNAKLSEWHAAIGLAYLSHWPEMVRARRALAAAYAAHLPASAALPAGHWDWLRSVMVVQVPGAADALAHHLAAHGIGTRRWYYPPLHQHAAWRGQPTAGPLPHTEKLAQTLLGLPFHLDLTHREVEIITAALA